MSSPRSAQLTMDAIAASLLVAMTAGVYLLGVAPAGRAAAAALADREELAARRDELKELALKVADRESACKELERIVSQSDHVLKGRDELNTRCQAISQEAQQAGLSVAELTP